MNERLNELLASSTSRDDLLGIMKVAPSPSSESQARIQQLPRPGSTPLPQKQLVAAALGAYDAVVSRAETRPMSATARRRKMFQAAPATRQLGSRIERQKTFLVSSGFSIREPDQPPPLARIRTDGAQLAAARRQAAYEVFVSKKAEADDGARLVAAAAALHVAFMEGGRATLRAKRGEGGAPSQLQRRLVHADADVGLPPFLRIAIEALLHQLPLTRALPAHAIARLAALSEFAWGGRYATVYREGEVFDGAVFVVLHGAVALTSGGRGAQRGRTVGVGGVVGTEGVLEAQHGGAAAESPATSPPESPRGPRRPERVARLHACAWAEPGVALVLPAALWRPPSLLPHASPVALAIVSRSLQLDADAVGAARAFLLSELLGRHPLFASLDGGALSAAAAVMGAHELGLGAPLFARGDTLDALHLVVLGAVRSTADAAAAGRLITADTASRDALLGARALRHGRRAHAEQAEGAAERTLLLSFPLHAIPRLLRAAPHLAPHCERATSKQLQEEERARDANLRAALHNCPLTHIITLASARDQR